MNEKEFKLAVKKHFQKFGFSEKVLDSLLTTLQPEDLTEMNEEGVTDLCTKFEPLASTFQKETDIRVQSAIKKVKGDTSDPDPEDEEEVDNPVLKALQALTDKVANLERGKTVGTNNELVLKGLQALKMTPSEIKSVMYGREFDDTEDATSFLETQSETYQEVLKERAEQSAGDGYNPHRASGNNYTKSQITADVEAFNKTNKIK